MNYWKKYTKSQETHWAILIEENTLKSLIKFIQKNFKEVQYLWKCKDNTRITFNDLDDLVNYSNNKGKHLINLSINAFEDEKSLNVNFHNYIGFIRPQVLSYDLTYNDEIWGYKFDDDLQNELRELIPWYSILTYFPITFALVPMLMLGSIFYIWLNFVLEYLNLPTYLDISMNDPIESTKNWDILFWFWMIPLFAIAYILDIIRDYLFPRLFIALWKQIKEFWKRKMISYIIFGIFWAWILVNYFYDKL